MDFYPLISEILKSDLPKNNNLTIGYSREGREIHGYRFGSGDKNISLIAGNHADEPVGPRLLNKLCAYLENLSTDHLLLKKYSWWIVPHTNPDGAEVNKKWYSNQTQETDLYDYLSYVKRELPGEDLEFGYKTDDSKDCLRPENESVYNFWKTASTPFSLHVSLHGLAKSYGSWFLLDENWKDRIENLKIECALRSKELGYNLFDLNRFGEKGFTRLGEGFCTRPDSKYMKEHFLGLKDSTTANLFNPSSMESIRSLGGDCLTLVSEMPQFIYPRGDDRELVWPDPYLSQWSDVFNEWKLKIISGDISRKKLKEEMIKSNVKPMNWNDQMKLQWQLIVSGLKLT